MAVHRDGDPTPDGDRGPDDGLGLPELPADVVIPDDASALAEEAEQVRAELRALRRRRAWRRRVRGGPGEPGHGVPLLVLCVAVAVTLVSLFVLAWSGAAGLRRSQPIELPAMPAVTLTDRQGTPTDLSTLRPMVIVLVERCRCTELIAETVAAAPPGVRVVVVEGGDSDPAGGTDPTQEPTRLVDAEGVLRNRLELGAPPTNAATVVLVDRRGRIVHSQPAAESVEPFRDLLAGLAR